MIKVVPRNPKYYARVGDIWKLDNRRHLVIDYKDLFLTGCTWTDGERGAQKYTDAFVAYLDRNGAVLVLNAEDYPFYPNTNEKGWTDDIKKIVTKEQSLDFIKERLKDNDKIKT